MNVALIATIFSVCFIKASSVNKANSIFPDAEKTRQERTIGQDRRGTGGGVGLVLPGALSQSDGAVHFLTLLLCS